MCPNLSHVSTMVRLLWFDICCCCLYTEHNFLVWKANGSASLPSGSGCYCTTLAWLWFFWGLASADQPYGAELCTGAVLPQTLTVPSSRLSRNSTTYLQMYTSSLPYLPQIFEDFLLLEKKSMFIFQLFIRNCTWRLHVFSVGVGC